jgi:hypothetical protein
VARPSRLRYTSNRRWTSIDWCRNSMVVLLLFPRFGTVLFVSASIFFDKIEQSSRRCSSALMPSTSTWSCAAFSALIARSRFWNLVSARCYGGGSTSATSAVQPSPRRRQWGQDFGFCKVLWQQLVPCDVCFIPWYDIRHAPVVCLIECLTGNEVFFRQGRCNLPKIQTTPKLSRSSKF